MTRMLLAFASLTFAQIVLASPIKETLIYKGVPSANKIKQWSAEGGPAKKFLFMLDVDAPSNLSAITQIQNVERIQVSTNVYPSPRSLPVWQALAQKDVHFVLLSLDGYFPTSYDAAMLNQAGFKSNTITLTAFPQQASDLIGIKSLTVPYTLNFAAGRYPNVQDLSVLQLIPLNSHFQYLADYWPRGAHTSVFNLLQQDQSLGISKQIPTSSDLEFMNKIERLENLNMEYSDGEVPTGVWARIAASLPQNRVHIRWTSRDRVPNSRELKEFFASAREGETRDFVMDRDQDLTSAERTLLESAAGQIEWIHEAQ